MTYSEAENYLNALPRFTAKHAPEDTRQVLRALGVPEGRMRLLHVAGTNGKGSVCRYLSEILCGAGIRTALFTSPHLIAARERMAVQGEEIPEADFVRLLELVRACVQREGFPLPSYFEFLFLMAMCWFEERQAEYAVLETGLGGRLDATNSPENKVLTVITRIGLDHTEYLGETIPEIAKEKAGILRRGVPLVCLSEPEEALAVFREKAASLGAPLFVVYPEDFRGRNLGKRIDFSYCSRYDLGDPQLQALLDTPALYQAENAALAVLAAGLLRGRDGRALLSAAQIAGGLERAHWPARMEEVADGVFIDGGHNEDGISAFLASAAGIPLEPGGRRSLLYSAVRDKRYAAMALSLTASGLFDRIILTPIAGARSLTEAELRETAEKMRSAAAQAGRIPDIEVMAPAKDAFAFLLRDKRPEDLVFAAGSLYLAGELRAYARDLLHAGYTFYRE